MAHAPHQPDSSVHERDRPWWQLRLPWFVTTAALIVLAMMVPQSCLTQIANLTKNTQSIQIDSTFSEDASALDRALREGAAVTPERLTREAIVDVTLRRMLDAGPMSGPELHGAKRMVREFQAQLDAEPPSSGAAGRRALREVHVAQLAARFPRLDQERLARAIASLDVAIARARRINSAPR